MNLANTINRRSDHTNADVLITGPQTVTITAVRQGTKEQPVNIELAGFEGRPYKPSKSMRRVLVTIWGKDASLFAGRRLTLYRDPTVKFGGDVVGGIKISHASDIDGPQEVLLTVTRGRRAPHTVLPLPSEQPKLDLGDLPEQWNDWSNEERGTYLATQSLEKLQAWWGSLPKGPEKKALEPKLRSDWKPAAEAILK